MSDLTLILQKMERGDPQAADQLMPLVYDELRKIAAGQMARESAGQTTVSAAPRSNASRISPTGPRRPPPAACRKGQPMTWSSIGPAGCSRLPATTGIGPGNVRYRLFRLTASSESGYTLDDIHLGRDHACPLLLQPKRTFRPAANRPTPAPAGPWDCCS